MAERPARTFTPSLRVRLTVYATLGALVLFVAGALLLYRDLTHQLSQAIDAELSVRLHDLESVPSGGTPARRHRLALTQVVAPDGTVLEPTGARSLLTVDELAVARKHRIVIDRAVGPSDEQARLMARELDVPGQRGPIIGVAAGSTKPLEAARDRLSGVLYIAGPALAALVGVLAWVLAGAVLRPVRRMTREASTISIARSGERLVEPRGHDEIAELGHTLNEMLERIGSAIAHERSFIDDAAHELRTPLAVLRGELEVAVFDLTDPAATEASLASALEETDRLGRLTSDLLTLARADAEQLAPKRAAVDLTAAAEDVARSLPWPDGVTVEVRGTDAGPADADPDWTTQIIRNLLANALRSAATAVRVTVDAVPGGVRLIVDDDGAGFPPEFLHHAFDRFARSADSRTRADGGSGLGLAITASLVDALGGTILAANGGTLCGASLVVVLPAWR